MKQAEDYTGQTRSLREYQRLEKLQEGINKKEVEKEFSDREKSGMQINSSRFEDNLKRDGRAQPLRQSDSAFDRARKKISKINAITNVVSKVNWGNDGVYFVVFIVSVIGDVGTAGIGAVQAIPGGGWVLGAILGASTQAFIFMISATVMVLYIMNGHYKKRRAAAKAMVLLGFTFSELMPIVTALPGFIGSFVINYAMVLYERTTEEALARDKMIGVNKVAPNQKTQVKNNIPARDWMR